MAAMSYLQKHPKSGVYRIRRAIPKAARFAFGGKHEFLRSLGTKEYRKAQSLALPLIAELQERIDKAQGLPLYETTEDCELATTAFLQWHWSTGGDDVIEYDDYIFDSRQSFLERLTEYCSVSGFSTNGQMFSELSDVIESEEDRLYERSEQPGMAPAAAITHALPTFHRGSIPAPSGRKITRHIKLSELCDALIEYKGSTTKKAEQEIRKTFAMLVELHGDLPVTDVEMEQVREFRDVLLSYPVTGRTKNVLALPLRQIAKMQWDHTLSPVTVRRQIGHIKQGFAYAVSEGLALFNPTDGLLIPNATATSRKTVRRELRPHELGKLFSSPLFNSCGGEGKEAKTGSTNIRNYKFWLPWVAFYTGARLAELCQLERTNLRQEANIWYLEITTIVDQDDAADKSLKTAGSTRNVPVHQILIDKGFIDYATKGKGPYIFATKFASPQEAAKDYSRWFGRYMSRIGLTDPALTFHSSRHNFKSACRMANIQKDVHDFLTGHSPQDVGGKYGSHERLMKFLKAEIDRVRYEGM